MTEMMILYDHLRLLVSGEDDYCADERRFEEVAHAGGINGDWEVEVRLFRVNGTWKAHAK
jgi:hypothetical protein